VAADLVHLVDEDEPVCRLLEQLLDRGLVAELLAGAVEQAPEQPRRDGRARPPCALAWMRTTVDRTQSAGLAASSSSTARISVVLPEPDEPISRMLPTLRPASFLESATDISRTASIWPTTRFSSALAIWAGDGGAGGTG
jgi:hypothetical protein